MKLVALYVRGTTSVFDSGVSIVIDVDPLRQRVQIRAGSANFYTIYSELSYQDDVLWLWETGFAIPPSVSAYQVRHPTDSLVVRRTLTFDEGGMCFDFTMPRNRSVLCHQYQTGRWQWGGGSAWHEMGYEFETDGIAAK